ncbi:hypothetical protein ACWCQS_18425 [Streptomyces sp. NPDC002076]
MHYASGPSWQFAEGTSEMLHAALFIRDAAALPVPASEAVPSALIEQPVCMDIPQSLDRELLAVQWLEWWRKLVRHEMSEIHRSHGGDGDDTALRLAQILQRQQDVFDPPDFDSLCDAPQLQALVWQSFRESLIWAEKIKRKPLRMSAFPPTLIKSVAENVAATHGVPVADVTGAIRVLDVEGIWSTPTGPGCMLCSTAAAADSDFAAALLRDTFVSGLRA